MKNCAILFGGSSEERLVSVASAQNLAGHFPEAKLYFLSKEGAVYPVSHTELSAHTQPFTQEFHPAQPPLALQISGVLDAFRNATVVLALHGSEGEDGTLQRIFEKNSIVYTGSNSIASANAFDKKKTKEIAKQSSLNLAPDYIALDPSNLQTHSDLREFFLQHKKIVLKPQANGSSVGLYLIHDQAQLEEAFEKLKVGPKIAYLAEAFITGREITVGVWEKSSGTLEALPCSEVRVNQGRQFDYEGKYLGSGVQELTPAPLSPGEALACQNLAIATHRALGCSGYSRTDMILTESGPILLEINTLPGLSKASFIPQQLAVKQVTLRTFFEDQMESARARCRDSAPRDSTQSL